MGKIGKRMGNPLKYMELYIKLIEMDGKWLGNGWVVTRSREQFGGALRIRCATPRVQLGLV